MFEWFVLALLVCGLFTAVFIVSGEALLGKASRRSVDWLHGLSLGFLVVTFFLLLSLFFAWLFGSLYDGMVGR